MFVEEAKDLKEYDEEEQAIRPAVDACRKPGIGGMCKGCSLTGLLGWKCWRGY